MPHVWINGNFLDAASASIPLSDAGLLHGVGVFTTMRVANSRIFRLTDHLHRVRDSCQAFSIPLQTNDETLAAAMTELLRLDNVQDARLRLTVTRGSIRQDPLHGPHGTPTVFITAAPLQPYPPDYYQTGMTVILLDDQKLNSHDIQAGHKTLNYLSRTNALRQAERQGAGEALWFDIHNRLQSACVANVFLVRNDTLLTPPTTADLRKRGQEGFSKGSGGFSKGSGVFDDPGQSVGSLRSCVLPGITRAAILDLAAKNGIEIDLTDIDVETLLEADEVFLTNSIQRVMPVCRIERHTVGTGKPGPITTKLAGLLESAIASA